MGCDIHSMAQVFKNGRWTTIAVDLDDDRNYDSFAVMANIRNGRGFAGVKTGEGWVPISEPRGLPEDLFAHDIHGLERRNFNLGGDHSDSWLLLSEMKQHQEYLRDKKYTKRGIVGKSEWEAIQKEGLTAPREWCGGLVGPDVTIVTPIEALNGSEFSHVEMHWEVDCLERLPTFNAYIEKLSKIAKESEVSDDAVRLIFNFDN